MLYAQKVRLSRVGELRGLPSASQRLNVLFLWQTPPRSCLGHCRTRPCQPPDEAVDLALCPGPVAAGATALAAAQALARRVTALATLRG